MKRLIVLAAFIGSMLSVSCDKDDKKDELPSDLIVGNIDQETLESNSCYESIRKNKYGHYVKLKFSEGWVQWYEDYLSYRYDYELSGDSIFIHTTNDEIRAKIIRSWWADNQKKTIVISIDKEKYSHYHDLLDNVYYWSDNSFLGN